MSASHLKSIFHVCPWVPQPIKLNHQSGFPQLSILLVSFPLDCREESNNCAVSSFPFFVSQRAVRIWRGLQSLLCLKFFFFLFSFWHFKCSQGPPRLRTRFVRQRGQTRVTDAIAERRTVITRLGNYEQGAEGETSVAGAAADPEIPGKSGSS